MEIMQINQMVSAIIDEHVKLVLAIEKNLLSEIRTAVRWSVDALKRENKILFAGNGGSAADAQHLAAEFIGRFQKDRPSLPALALTTDTSILTAVGNDYGFEKIFARQIEGLVKEGDIFFAISTSGNSENVIEAVKVCRKRSCSTIGLLGKNGGKLAEIVDLPIIIESDNTARIQENHIVIGHMICQLVENILFGKDI
jgi:D-sedoheptulose 7-phosphate isomerase